MSVIDKLSTSLGKRDETANVELAKQLASKKDKRAIQELAENLANKNKGIQNNCIKVLYEIGERNPALISPYAKDFLALLDAKNNRLQWGAMTALHTITLEEPKLIAASLPRIIAAADRGSVITKDYAVNILIKLCSLKQYGEEAFPMLIAQLRSCPTNQLPMYAERALPIVTEKNKKTFAGTLSRRLDDIEKESKRKRIEKVIKKVSRL